MAQNTFSDFFKNTYDDKYSLKYKYDLIYLYGFSTI